jgi:hypothetical protein
MKRKLLISSFLSLVVLFQATGQNNSAPRDKFTLLTMPYNKRPLTLYRGELQVNAGYKFAIRSRSYDKDGNLIILKDIGTASVYHYYFMEMKYGITNFLEISAQTNYLKRGVRSVTENYFATSAEAITVNTVTETKGLGDILLMGSLRLPVTFKWFDFSIRGGAFVPSAKYEPAQPVHRVSNITAANSFTVDYQFKNKNGYGVPVWMISGATKFSFKKLSLEADFTYRQPVKEGENIRWDQELAADKSFTYSKNTYDYLLNESWDASASLHFQAAGWLNIQMNSSYFHSGGGWTEYWGDKYRNRKESLFSLEPALEIQISPAITIYEVAGFPLSGKNMDGPFYLFMTVSFNTFPFFKK